MRKFIVLSFIFLGLVGHSFGAKLIYSGRVSSDNTVFDTAPINTRLYSQIRVYIALTSTLRETSYIRPPGQLVRHEPLVAAATGIGDYASLDLGLCTGLLSCSFLVDMPPDAIKIRLNGPASYKVFVWGK